MAPTPEQTQAGYHNLWNRAAIRMDKQDAAEKIARRMLAARDKYQAVEAKTGVPWFMIAALHSRESSLDFATHLHCGDPLAARTYHVPKGRPKAPPANGRSSYTWEESAIDALTMPGKAMHEIKNWSVERILYESEKFNGWGYLGRGNSPYIWAWTTEYHGGKYVADHVYDPSHWDTQAGCAALIKTLAALDPAVARRLATREPAPPADVQARATASERAARNGGAAAGGTGAVQEGAKASTAQPDKVAIMPAVLAWTLIGVGVAVAIVATVLIVRKAQLIRAKWS